MIPVAKPYITNEDEQAVAKTVRSGWILQGPRVEKFESLLKNYIHIPCALATSSATTALHMGLLALGIGPGDEVIVPSFSFIASANCIMHVGATPVFVDIDPRTYNVDPLDVERKITKKTKAIMAVHQIGLPADIPTIKKLISHHSQHIALIEDAACALGAYIGDKHVGTFGTFGAFSFHPRKAITTGEGGLFTTQNKSLAKTVEMLRSHGASVSVSKRHLSTKVMKETYPIVGYNFRMSDIHAALGISQFSHLPYILKRRKEIADTYTHAFRTQPRIITPYTPPGMTHAFQTYMVRIDGGASIRDTLMQRLLDAGIATRAGIMTSHTEKPYKKLYPTLHLPHTELATKETLILPLYPKLTTEDQERVIATLLDILQTM